MRMRLKDIKIGSKLAWGFGILLAIMAVLIVVAIANLRAIHGDLDRIVKVNNTRQALASDMAGIVREDAIAVRNGFLQRERVQEMIKRMDGNNTKFEEAFRQVEETTSKDDAEGMAILERIREIRDTSRTMNNKTMVMMAENRFDEAFTYYEKESRAAVRTAIQATEDLSKHQGERSMMRYEQSTKHYNDTRTYMTLLGAGALLLGMFMAIVLTRNIVRPLREGVAAANRLSEGDLTVQLDASRHDELGQLLLAMKTMVEKLNTVVTDVIGESSNVSSGSQQLAAGAEEMSQGTTEQAASTEEASSTVEQLNATIKQNADNARQTEQMSFKSASDAGDSGKAVTDAVTAMRDIAAKIAIVEEIARPALFR